MVNLDEGYAMTRIKLIGLTLIATLAIAAVVSASASALQWLLSGKPITSRVAVTGSGKLLLADTKAIGGESAIVCEGTAKGFAGPAAKSEVTELKASKCSFQAEKNSSCEASSEPTASALNLPWLSLLLSFEGFTRTSFTAPGGKVPGWKLECQVAGIFKVSDECTATSAFPEVVNLAAGVGILVLGTGDANCSNGGDGAGTALGTILAESPKGSTLSVSLSSNK